MAENEEKLKRLKALRSGNRAVITRYINETSELLNKDGDSANTTERLRTIANLLKEKIEQVKQLDSEILDLCDVSVQEIEESEIVYSRACDVQAKITKFTSRSVETINKSEVQVHETTNTEQNTEANESGQSVQSIAKHEFHAGHEHASSEHEHVNPEFEHANSQCEHTFNAKSTYSREIQIVQVNST